MGGEGGLATALRHRLPLANNPIHLKAAEPALCDCVTRDLSESCRSWFDGSYRTESSKPQPTLIEGMIPGFLG